MQELNGRTAPLHTELKSGVAVRRALVNRNGSIAFLKTPVPDEVWLVAGKLEANGRLDFGAAAGGVPDAHLIQNALEIEPASRSSGITAAEGGAELVLVNRAVGELSALVRGDGLPVQVQGDGAAIVGHRRVVGLAIIHRRWTDQAGESEEKLRPEPTVEANVES